MQSGRLWVLPSLVLAIAACSSNPPPRSAAQNSAPAPQPSGGDSPSNLKLTDAVVPLAAQPQRLISAEFQVIDNFGSVLVIRNHFDRTLRYKAVIKVPNRQPAATTVCPVRGNLRGVEHWPHPIELIAFGDFSPLGPGDSGDCR